MKAWTIRGTVLACVVCAILNLFAGCKGAQDAAAIGAITAAYQAELAQCIIMAKNDSGKFEEYQDCACAVDRKYHVDAGVCK